MELKPFKLYDHETHNWLRIYIYIYSIQQCRHWTHLQFLIFNFSVATASVHSNEIFIRANFLTFFQGAYYNSGFVLVAYCSWLCFYSIILSHPILFLSDKTFVVLYYIILYFFSEERKKRWLKITPSIIFTQHWTLGYKVRYIVVHSVQSIWLSLLIMTSRSHIKQF